MPTVRVTGKNKTPGPSAFGEAMQAGIGSGVDVFANLSDAQRQAQFNSPSFQSGGWKPAAVSAAHQKINDAFKASGAEGARLAGEAIRAAAMLQQYGALPPELSSASTMLQQRYQSFPSAMHPTGYGNTAMVLYEPQNVNRRPVQFASSSAYAPLEGNLALGRMRTAGPERIGDPASPMRELSPGAALLNTELHKLALALQQNTSAERELADVEKQRVNQQQQADRFVAQRGHGPITIGPSFVPPGTALPGQAPAFVPPGTLPGGGSGPPGVPPGGRPPGGGSGGGSGGYGGGGFKLPFAGAVGLTNTSKMMTAGIAGAVGGATAGAAVGIIEELLSLPWATAHLASGMLQGADATLKQRYGTAALGRAGGFSGPALADRLYGGGGALGDVPDWMKKYGLSPAEGLGLITGFGIVPRSDAQGQGIGEGLASYRMIPGLSGMPSGATESLARTAAKYGMIAPDKGGIETFGNQLGGILQDAVARGNDRTAVFRSIEGLLASSGRTNSNVSPEAFAEFSNTFATLPGGHTGESALTFAAGSQEAYGSVGVNSARTAAISALTNQFPTTASLAARFAKTPGGRKAFDLFAANPVHAEQLARYEEAKRNGSPYAAQALSDVLGDTGLAATGVPGELLADSPMLDSLTDPTAKAYARSALSGVPIQELASHDQGMRMQSYDADIKAAAAETGLPEAAIRALGLKESGWKHRNADGSINNGGSNDVGIMQLQPGAAQDVGGSDADRFDPHKNIILGARYYKQRLMAAHGNAPGPYTAEDYKKGYEGYNGGPGYANSANLSKIEANADVFMSLLRGQGGLEGLGAPPPNPDNTPTSDLATQAQAYAESMRGSTASLATLKATVDGLNTALKTLHDIAASVTPSAYSNPFTFDVNGMQ